ncbi:MAG: LUD domain-containing protein [Solirubrobacterales bacterium]
MSSARSEILASIRAANAAAARPAPTPTSPTTPPTPAPTGPAAATRASPPAGALLDLLAERVDDYRATVTRIADDAAIADAIAAILQRHGAQRIAVPGDLPAAWRPPHAELVVDDPPLDHRALGALDGALTGCALAIAETGTLVLDGGTAQGRRALTLLPDLHVCVVLDEQVVAGVPDAIAALAATRRPVTFVSGPSATSDIELERVEGVHGPRRLEVVLVAAAR